MWEISNDNQIITFMLSIALGGIFYLLYDVIRAVRKVGFNSSLAVNIIDLIIWIIFAFATFIFLMARTNGEIRGYVLFGEAIGFVLIRASISKIWFRILRFVLLKIAYIKRKIDTRFYTFTDNVETRILKRLKYAFKLLKSIKKCLKNIAKLLYNKINIVDKKRSLNETKT